LTRVDVVFNIIFVTNKLYLIGVLVS